MRYKCIGRAKLMIRPVLFFVLEFFTALHTVIHIMDARTKPLTKAEREARDAAVYAAACVDDAAPAARKQITAPDAQVPIDSDVSPYKPGLRSRGWVFTWNNPVLPTGFNNFIEYYKAWEPLVSYLVVGNEHAPTTGTPHHQGAVWFKNQRTWPACRSTIKCWWAPAKGSGEQNFDYSKKENILIEYGERKQQGNRADLEDVRELIRGGASMREVTERASNYQAMKVGELYLRYHPEFQQKRNWEMEVWWLKGPAGIGKTRWASEQAPHAHYSSRNLQWWDGYADQKDVIIDDFRGDFCTYHELLRIADRYPYRVQIKGSSCELLAKRLFFTSNMLPHVVYKTREDLWQLLRRISAVYEFNEDGSANIWRYVNKVGTNWLNVKDEVDPALIEPIGKLPPRTVELEKPASIIVPGLGIPLPPRGSDVELIIKNPADSTQKSGGNKRPSGFDTQTPPADPPTDCVIGDIFDDIYSADDETIKKHGFLHKNQTCEIVGTLTCKEDMLAHGYGRSCTQDGKCSVAHSADEWCDDCIPDDAPLIHEYDESGNLIEGYEVDHEEYDYPFM